MDYRLQQIDAARKDLHNLVERLAFNSYLRTGQVPLELKMVLLQTESLEALEKYNPHWQSQPRAPTGQPNGGQWTDGGAGEGEVLNIDKAVEHLNENARAVSSGLCARYVRRAIQAGGLGLKPPYPKSAKDYGAYLEKYGFVKVRPRPAPKYLPKRGDIVVIQPYSASYPHGHIAMYNGERWVSDFFQQGGSIWPGPGYRQHQPEYDIYRQ
jgi:hypothetical protein